MGQLSDQLKEYLATATPEQLEEEWRKITSIYGTDDPSPWDELDTLMYDIEQLNKVGESALNAVLSGEYEKAHALAMEYFDLKKQVKNNY